MQHVRKASLDEIMSSATIEREPPGLTGRARKSKNSKRKTWFDHLISLVIEVCLVAAMLIGGFLGWQLFWTSYQVQDGVNQAISQFEEANPAQEQAQHVEPEHRTDAPPTISKPGNGVVFGLLHVPSWDYMRTPIAAGTGSNVLDLGYAGWYDDTQAPGEVGNFAIAGHRRTYGNNFRLINHLQKGDEIVVETENAYIVYEVFDYEIVTPDHIGVVYPVPNHPELPATDRLITLTSCNNGTDTSDNGQWGNSHRWVTYGKFSYWTDKAEGKPSVILDETLVNSTGTEH